MLVNHYQHTLCNNPEKWKLCSLYLFTTQDFSLLYNVLLWIEFYITMNIINISLHIVISNFTNTHTHTHTHTQNSTISQQHIQKGNHEVVIMITIILFMEEMMSLFQLLPNWEKYSKGQLYYKMISASASLACQYSTVYCQIYHRIHTLFVHIIASTKITMQIPINKCDQNRRKFQILMVFCKNACGHLLSNNKWVKKRR